MSSDLKHPDLLSWVLRFLWRFAVVYVAVVLIWAVFDWTHTWQTDLAGALIVGTSLAWTIERGRTSEPTEGSR